VDTTRCEVLLRAVDCGSLSAAGEQMGYTPSGVNRMVTALEDELGFKVLRRTRKGVGLTPDGAHILPTLRQFVRSGEQVLETAAEINGIIRGSLTIGSYYSVAACWLPQILKTFQKDYSGITVNTFEASTSELIARLDDHSVDFCFLGNPVEGYDWIPLKEDSLVVWLPIDHPKAGLSVFPVHDIDGEPFIWPMPNNEVDLEHLVKVNHLEPDIRYTTYDSYTAYSMVAAGLGISANNALMTKKWTGQVRVLPFDPPQSITLGIAVPSLTEASPAVIKFIDCSERVIAKL